MECDEGKENLWIGRPYREFARLKLRETWTGSLFIIVPDPNKYISVEMMNESL